MAQTSFVEYYDRFRPLRGYFRFLWGAAFSKNNAERRSFLNRAEDYLRLSKDETLRKLHLELSEILERQAREWPHYDYGEGYFYQGLAALGITGLRSTEARISSYRLLDHVAGKSVLDIGCNAGFLAVSLAQSARDVTGFDINPFLIEAGNAAARVLQRNNVRLSAGAFEDAALDGPYDVVMSLANHSTFDGQTRYSLNAYFDRCQSLLRPQGLFLFESHTPSFEGSGLTDVCDMIAARFRIRDRRIYDYGTYLDRGRTFIVAESRD